MKTSKPRSEKITEATRELGADGDELLRKERLRRDAWISEQMVNGNARSKRDTDEQLARARDNIARSRKLLDDQKG